MPFSRMTSMYVSGAAAPGALVKSDLVAVSACPAPLPCRLHVRTVCDGHSWLVCRKDCFAGFFPVSQRSLRLAQQVPHHPIATNGGRRREREISLPLGSADSFFPTRRPFAVFRFLSLPLCVSPPSLSVLKYLPRCCEHPQIKTHN